MKRSILAVLLVTALAASGCTGRNAVSPGRAISDGPILVQQVNASGGFESVLRITGVNGESGTIKIRHPSVGLATGIPGKALYPTDNRDVYLVDAIAKTARRLDIPTGTRVVPNQAAFGRSDRFTVLGSPTGAPAFLVDAKTGATTDLTSLGLSKTVFSGEFSPDGSYYAFTGDAVVLVPTADPRSAIRLGRGRAGFAGFTLDGKRLAYVDLTNPRRPQAVIQDVNGSDRRRIGVPPGVIRARLLEDGGHMLLESRGVLLLLDVATGKETRVLETPSPPQLVWFSPRDNAALVGTQGTSSHTAWTWLNLEAGRARGLPDLAGDQPILSSVTDRLVFFSDGSLPGRVRTFSVLDLVTGEDHRVFSFPHPQLVAGQQIAVGGRFALVPVQDRGGGGELWLLPADEGKARRLATSSGGIAGTFSPSGKWVAVTEVSPGGAGGPVSAGLTAVSTVGDRIRDLGQGVGPVWTRG